jgi:D-3-phosphoglycerate dehydrogenase / 2-oxoglutarate reductase
MPKARVWTHAAFEPEALAVFDNLATVSATPPADSEGWYAEAATCAGLIVSGNHYITGDVMDRLGARLRVVGRPGIGVDRIDLAAATERGILVVNTPDGPTESTAEHAIALLLSLTKRVTLGDRGLRAGQGWADYGVIPIGLEAFGATLGLVGLGRIGGRVAEIARALGMRVLAFDPYAAPARAEALGVTLVGTLEELLASADVVSLHCPAIPATYQLINTRTLALMRRGSYLINVARGTVIDEAALVDALRSGHLAGAGLDVFDPEPAAADNPLFSLPNTICTPHIASYTNASVLRMRIMICAQVASALRGERPTELVNPEVWKRRRESGALWAN